jgi:exonuclease VII large subunit
MRSPLGRPASIGDESAFHAPTLRFHQMKDHMQKRRRIKHEKSFEQRLAEEAQRFREAAKALPPGMARELLLKRARQAEGAAHMNHWLKSTSPQPRDKRVPL